MPITSLMDLYVDELADLYDAESQVLKALPRLIDAAQAPDLRDVLSRHCEESRLHIERLELIFTRLGDRGPGRACSGMAGIVQEADERVHRAMTPDACDAAIIGLARRMEHYEIAAYGCARTYARRLNRADEARLLQETLDEEGRADHRLAEIATAHIVDDARSEADVEREPSAPSHRLRYVAAKQVDYHRLADGDLEVRNETDDHLGVFDGLVVATPSNRPRYVVVHARRLLGGRRYLLPAGEVRYDPAGRLLRVNLDRDVAERYPAFERDEFEAMDPAALRGYESTLIGFFRRSDDTRRLPHTSAEPEPEWLMTGVWLTVPPEQAATLTDEARTFANEFVPNREQVTASANDRQPVGDDESETPPHGDDLRGKGEEE